MKPVVILGATGTTGKQIAKFLNAENIPVRLAARNRERLDALAESLGTEASLCMLDIENRASVEEAIKDSSLVLNCVGPFSYFGNTVIDACLEEKLHYLDITGEQSFIKQVIEKYSAIAKERGVCLVPSAAFEFTFGESAVALLANKLKNLEEVEITYSFKRIATSRGTNNSVIAALSSPAFHLVKNQEIRIQPGKEVTPYRCEISRIKSRFPFPGGEVYLAPLHTNVRTIRTYLGAENPALITRGVSYLSMNLFSNPEKMKLLRKPIESFVEKTEQAIPESLQERTFFLINVQATGKDGQKKEKLALTIKGVNPYRLTAAIMCLLAKELLGRSKGQSRDLPGGVMAASMLCGPDKLVDLSRKYGVRWIED